MSEPSQLVVRVQIDADAFKQYLQHQVEPAGAFEGFPAWLAGKQWHGDMSAAELIAGTPSGHQVEQWRSGFTEGKYAKHYQPVRDHYDAATGEWTLVVFQFDENYGGFVDGLNVLRQVAPYARPEPASYVTIVPLWFGEGFDEPDAVLEIRDGKARFIDQAPPEFIAWTGQVVDEMASAAAAAYDD